MDMERFITLVLHTSDITFNPKPSNNGVVGLYSYIVFNFAYSSNIGL